MLLSGWWKWWAGLVVLGTSQSLADLEWPQVRPIVAAHLSNSPMAETLQTSASLPQSYAYVFSRSDNGRSNIPAQSQLPSNGFLERSGVAGEAEESEDEVKESRGRSSDAQPRFIGKFKEWYKEKEKDKKEDEPHIIISHHTSNSHHDHDSHSSYHGDHGHGHHGHGHGYHDAHIHGYPYHHSPPPIYHYPHHNQQPVVQPIFIESGRGHGKGKMKASTVTAAATHTVTEVVTQPKPVVMTHTVTQHPYNNPSHIYIQSPNPPYVKPSHVYIHSHKPTYVTPSQVFIQPSQVYIQEPQTEYVAVSVESDNHGWGWGWDLFGKGKGSTHHHHLGDSHGHYGDGHHHYGNGHHHYGQGEVVYVVGKPHHHHVAPQHTTTQIIVEQQVPLMSHITQPTTSEVMIMEAPGHSIKKGFQKVKDTFKAFGDGIKDVGEEIKHKIAKGVDEIKSKFSFKGGDSHHHHYVMADHPHSVTMVQPDVTQTVVVQKPITQTVTYYHPKGGSDYKGGSILKGLFKGHSSSKGGDKKVIYVNSGGGHSHQSGGGHSHQSGGGHSHQSDNHHHSSGCTHCG